MSEEWIVAYFCITVFIIAGMFAWIIAFTRRFENYLKDIKTEQFDANQVMKIFQAKSIKPVVYRDRYDVKELKNCTEIPWELYKNVENDNGFVDFMKKDLAKSYLDLIIPFIEIQVENDPVRLKKKYYTRLRVIDPHSKELKNE